jgi:acetylornithine deacetylase/succinyl-diaminopimelate desuccinylase-like protein
VTVRLVDWADEEGARFGKSLFGSSACSGNLNLDEARGLKDKDGIRLPDALKEIGVDLERAKECGKELKNAAAYLELHIEQGPVLLDLDLPLGAVLGTFGVERHAITFHGQAAHSGSTPMNRRKDAFARRRQNEPGDLSHRRPARRRLHHRLLHDQAGHRHQRGGRLPHHAGPAPSGRPALALMLADARAAADRFAHEGNVRVSWERLWQIEPVLFNPVLIGFCDDAIGETCGKSHRLPSGPLHDAAEVARAGVPTVMMFVQSLHGISHNKIEDTREEHLELCVAAFDRLADKTMQWI